MFFQRVNIRVVSNTLNHVKNYPKTTRPFTNYAFPKNHDTNTSYTMTKNDVKRKPQDDLIEMAMESINVTKPEDWKKVTEFVLQHELNRERNKYNSGNIDGMIMGWCVNKLKRSDIANSYLKYLEEQNRRPNLATIGKYLKLLYQNNIEKISKDNEKEILRWCREIQQNNPVLDSITQENIIMALSLTKEWKECLDILQEIKITAVPNTASYSALTAAAFMNKEEQLAWDILGEMLDHERPPLSITFQSYLKTLKRLRKQENIEQKLEKLFLFFQENEIICQEDVAKDIMELFKSSGHATTVTFSGNCKACKTKLKTFELNETEFSELKQVFLKNVIVGKDIFIKSNPTEMEEFQSFVQKMGKFDVVLDGLNIAYSAGVKRGPHVFSHMVAAVVSHFVQQNKSVLMLGRVHMKRWPKNNWNYITENSTVFLTQNISQDDPYLLYCALHSGKDTTIVSKDLMRGHKFLLKDRKYKNLFDRWLSQRQYFLSYVNDDNKVTFRIPPHFSAIAQKNDNIWHIPYILDSEDPSNDRFHDTWLCLDFNK